MITIWWVVVAMVLGVCWTIWRLVRSPGGCAYAFHEEHREARKVLGDARGALRELRSTARRETWQARADVKQSRPNGPTGAGSAGRSPSWSNCAHRTVWEDGRPSRGNAQVMEAVA